MRSLPISDLHDLRDNDAEACSRLGASGETPDCSRRLVLSECLDRWRHEVEQGEVDTGRYRCRYAIWGRGPTLVLIPGMASDTLSYVMLMARLQTHFRCISYNLPDGQDDGARMMKYRHDDLVEDLIFLLDHLRVRECNLFGFSFGSTITLAALTRQPWRFTRALLQGGFARRPLAPAEVFLLHWLRFLPGRVGNLPLFARVVEPTHRAVFRGREPEVWDYFMERTKRVPLRAFASRGLMIHRLDLRPILPTIHQPVLMVCGDRDPLVGKVCERELMQGLPYVARGEIEECGHNPHLSHPEVLAELAGQFLLPQSCAKGVE